MTHRTLTEGNPHGVVQGGDEDFAMFADCAQGEILAIFSFLSVCLSMVTRGGGNFVVVIMSLAKLLLESNHKTNKNINLMSK